MIQPQFARIVIDPEVESSTLVEAIRRNARDVEIVVEPTSEFAAGTRHLSLTEGKRLLLVRRFQGRAFKLCQGWKPNYACCNLHTLAEANNCSMECTYCILQFYMNTPHLTLFGNLEDIQREIAEVTERDPERIHRIGTGELSDSLLLDPLAESTAHMVPFFRSLANGVLELKTKTDNIDGLLAQDGGERTVVSWSVNPEVVVARDELKTAPLAARLAAASRVAEAGYPVGFHLDPMIYHDGWETTYPKLVDQLLDAVPAERIAWISMGSLRFPPEMKPTMETRFPGSRLLTGELIRGDDGKYHYVRPLRTEMYRAVLKRLRERVGSDRPGPVAYLCMEPPEVWKRVFGESPTNAELEFKFAESYARRFKRADLPQPKQERYEAFAAATAAEQGVFVPVDELRSVAK